MTQVPYQHNQTANDFPATRVAACSIGSTLIVANKSSTTLNVPSANQVGDPWFAAADIVSSDESVYSSDSTSDSGLLSSGFAHDIPNSNNIRPIPCKGYNYANFYHLVRGNNTTTVSPRIMVYGRVFRAVHAGEGGKAWPNDDDQDFPNVGSFWIPLTQPGESTAYLELPTTYGGRFLNKMYISAPAKYVYLQGCEQIMAFVVQAATITNTQPVSMSSSAVTLEMYSSSSSAGSDTTYGMIACQLSG